MGSYTSQADENFFGAIGRLVISWGHLELGLDAMVEIMYHGCNGHEIQPEIPRALSRKLKFLRVAFARLPLPEDAANGYHSLFDAIDAAAVRRHDIIHGAIVEHVERSGEAKAIRILRDRGGTKRPREINISTKSILESAVEAQRLGSKTLYLVSQTHAVIEELTQQRGEQNSS